LAIVTTATVGAKVGVAVGAKVVGEAVGLEVGTEVVGAGVGLPGMYVGNRVGVSVGT
jgi:hypothetical protein